jgi:hypothetical protein
MNLFSTNLIDVPPALKSVSDKLYEKFNEAPVTPQSGVFFIDDSAASSWSFLGKPLLMSKTILTDHHILAGNLLKDGVISEEQHNNWQLIPRGRVCANVYEFTAVIYCGYYSLPSAFLRLVSDTFYLQSSETSVQYHEHYDLAKIKELGELPDFILQD